jgi:hypothetical protein
VVQSTASLVRIAQALGFDRDEFLRGFGRAYLAPEWKWLESHGGASPTLHD